MRIVYRQHVTEYGPKDCTAEDVANCRAKGIGGAAAEHFESMAQAEVFYEKKMSEVNSDNPFGTRKVETSAPMPVSTDYPGDRDKNRVARLLLEDNVQGRATFNKSDYPYSNRCYFTVEIEVGDKHMDFEWRSGNPETPDLTQVMNTLVEDAYAYDNADSYEEWAKNMGYDLYDSADFAASQDQWRDLQAQTKDVKWLLGDKYDSYVYGN